MRIFLLTLLISASALGQPLKLVVPIGHTAPIQSIAASPDLKYIYTAGDDKKMIIWDYKTGLELRVVPTGTAGVEDLQINKDGSRILGGRLYNRRQSVPLWDKQGNLISWLTDRREIISACFFPDGKQVLTAGYAKYLMIWDAETGQLKKEIDIGDELIWDADITPDGKNIVVAFGYSAGVWNAETGENIFKVEGHEGIVSAASFSHDKKFLATTSNDKTSKVWDGATGKLIQTLNHKLEGDEIVFNADASSVLVKTLSIGDGKSVELFSVTDGKKTGTLVEAKNEALMAVFSPDGKNVITAAEDDSLAYIWDAASGRKVGELNHRNTSGIRDAIFSSDGKTLFTRSSYVMVWAWQDRKLLQVIPKSTYGFHKFILAPDQNAVIASEGNEGSIWNLKRQQKEHDLKGITASINEMSFTPDGKRFITNGTGSSLRLWDLKTGAMLFQELYTQPDAENFLYSPSYKKLFIDYKYPRKSELFDAETSIRVTLQNESPIIRWAFSSDEKHLATADIERKVQVWDTETGKLVRTLDGNTNETINIILFSQDAKKLVTTTNNDEMIIWDVQTGNVFARHKNFHKDARELTLIPNSHWMISEQYSGLIKVWDLRSGKLHATLSGHKEPARNFYLTPDGKRLITHTYREKLIKLWNIQTGQLISDLKHVEDIDDVIVSEDGNYVAAGSSLHPTVLIWDANTGGLLHKITVNGRSNHILIRGKNNSFFTVAGFDSTVSQWDLKTGNLITTIHGHKDWINSLYYDQQKHQLISTSKQIVITDLNSGNSVILSDPHGAGYRSAVFGEREGTILANAYDFTIKLWDLKSRSVLQTFLPVNKGDYFTAVEGGYYKTSAGAAKNLHYVTDDLKPVSFEQMDLKFNRPDIVLWKAGFEDTALISSYRKAYQKRLTRLGVDTTVFNSANFPVLEIVDADQISYEQQNNKLTIRINGSDASSNLRSFNVWVNESPLFGSKGIIVSGKKNQIDTTITLTLSEGRNIIEASVTNAKGIESFRSPVRVDYRPLSPETRKIYFIGIGIDEFKEKEFNLNWSVKDIRDLSKAIRKKYGSEVVIDTLFNTAVTKENISTLKKKLEGTSVNDIVIVSYSGHGLLDKNYNYYLSTYGVNFREPSIAGLPYEELEELMDGIPARKKLMLIDACHSGEVDKEEMERYTLVERTEKDTTLKSGRKPVPTDAKLGMKSSFELMQELFVNVSRNTGTTVIAAAGGTQFAQEKGELENGVFTFAVLELMKERYQTTTVSDLQNYVNRRVPELTKGLQAPTTRSEVKAVDWKLW